ncbi:MAG: AAA family ATPase [Anaerolineae bacterium]|nr:AAA family ATPase [Anaerolineae bacterium]
MFTQQAHQLLEQAKAGAAAQGAAEIALTAWLSAVGRHAEGRVLLARCVQQPVDRLRLVYGIPLSPQPAMTAALPLAGETQAILERARSLARQVPDRAHPGLISLRHLIAATALSRPACTLLETRPITEQEAIQHLVTWYNADAEVPELGDLTDQLRDLRAMLLEQVFGQDHAVQAFVEGLFNAEVTASSDAARRTPKAVFIFAGPPGVGKTYLAELGAAYLGRPARRFDMSSYADHQQHNQLIGFAPSYQAAQPGTLTDYVAQHPDAFLIFDEVEKAHLNTIHLFLQVLDAGVLDDKFTGEAVSFRDTVIIFTTNAAKTLYDRPNETGINAANATFHRRTILDALRTESGPHGDPAFPPPLCSRLSMGYPVLFNHLGVNELEHIARREIERVSDLVEQQYYKTITFDPLLALMLVLREGASTDARTVQSQSNIFVKTEIFKFSDLYERRRLERVLKDIDTLHIGFDPAEMARPEIGRLFHPTEKPRVLLVAAEELSALFETHIPEVAWTTVRTTQDALQVLASEEVDMVLLDIWLGRDISTLGSTVGRALQQFDHVPAASHVLAEGQACLRAVHERLPMMPVYLLSLTGDGLQEGTVDEDLFLACVRSGGARGVLTTGFTGRASARAHPPDWERRREHLAQAIHRTALSMFREKQARVLTQARKVLHFDTVPAVDHGARQVTIQLRNLRLSRAIAAEDASEILEEVERPTTRFSDVVGADAAKEALGFVIDWLKNPRRYAALGVRPPRGILLTGPPGTGKTMLARALAGESDVAFLVASGVDFVTIWQGSGPQNVRDLFTRARRYAPAIVFIDELDAIGRRRSGVAGSGRAEENTLNALLTEMDGFGAPTLAPIILLAATNVAEQLDRALLRRFDRIIEVPPPDREARAAFLRQRLCNRKLSEVTDDVVDSLAGRSAGMTIADLDRVVNEAMVMAARQGSPVTGVIVEETFERERMGEAKSTPDPATLKRIAYHEAGHALVGCLTGDVPVQATIVGRGTAGGYVERESEENKLIHTRGELETLICRTMGGRAAEVLIYGEDEGLSTGASSDLRQAAYWAGRMVREFGMSAVLGPLHLSPDAAQTGPLGGQIHEEIRHIVQTQLERAYTLLETHREALDTLAGALLTKNRLTRAEIVVLLPALATGTG